MIVADVSQYVRTRQMEKNMMQLNTGRYKEGLFRSSVMSLHESVEINTEFLPFICLQGGKVVEVNQTRKRSSQG